MKMLVVDNHPVFLELMTTFFQEQGWTVQKASGGLEAIDILKTYQPDMAFIDLVMPYMDGNQLCRYIRSKPDYADIVLIIVSGIAAEVLDKKTPAYADASIAKGPFSEMKRYLLELISLFSQNYRDKVPDDVIGTEKLYSREVTRELLTGLRMHQMLLSKIDDGILVLNKDRRIVFANQGAEQLIGINSWDLLSLSFPSLFSTDMETIFDEAFLMSHDEGISLGKEFPLSYKERYIQCDINRFKEDGTNAFLVVLKDVTHFKTTERALNDTLVQKERLFSEVNHRIKNNLHMINSLLHIQKQSIRDDEVLQNYEDLSSRIHTIALIHEMLHNLNMESSINFTQYVGELASLVLSSMLDVPANLQLEICQVDLPVEKSITLGLIINELITNAIKYGFIPYLKETAQANWIPRLAISLIKDKEFRLTVSNNGAPFPEDIDIGAGTTLGLSLVSNFAQQLNGRILIQRGAETAIELYFPDTLTNSDSPS